MDSNTRTCLLMLLSEIKDLKVHSPRDEAIKNIEAKADEALKISKRSLEVNKDIKKTLEDIGPMVDNVLEKSIDKSRKIDAEFKKSIRECVKEFEDKTDKLNERFDFLMLMFQKALSVLNESRLLPKLKQVSELTREARRDPSILLDVESTNSKSKRSLHE